MHFAVLTFHECFSLDSILAKRSTDATEEDGAHMEFTSQISVAKATKEYKDFLKNNPDKKEEYPTLDNYMESYNGYKLQDGEYGYENNIDYLYDWYTEGGRWANLLPVFPDEAKMKKLVAKGLNLKSKIVQQKFKDDVARYLEIKEMDLMNACIALGIGGGNSIRISKNIPAKMILEWMFARCKDDYTELDFENIMEQVVGYFLLETNQEGCEELIEGTSSEQFIQLYNYYADLNEKGRHFQLTMLDMHT